MKKICVIVPCYNEQEVLPIFYEKINEVIESMKNYSFEIIFVNDGSRDKTLSILQELSKKDNKIKYISFSTNFGKESAMLAGLDYSTGEYIAVMDADLQDPPKLLKKMVKILEEEGYDCVGTKRITRKGEPKIRSFFARCFYKIINKISRVKMVDGARDFRLMTRQMVDEIISMREYNRYSKGLWNLPGFKTKWLGYENIKRAAGKTKWSFFNLFTYAIECITSFSTIPLVLSFIPGLIMFVISIILLIIYIANQSSSTLFIVFVILLVGSIQLFFIGILGLYLGKSYIELKKRPIYIIKEANIIKE